LGTLMAFAIRSAFEALPEILPRGGDVGLSAPVLLYTLTVSLVAGFLFGLAPAFHGFRVDPQISLKKGGHGSTPVHLRTQGSFIVVQVASTLVLLVGTGLLLRTMVHLRNTNPGFDSQNIISLKVGVSPSLKKTPSSTRVAYEQLMERIRQIPGVEAADFTTAVPLSGQGGYLPFWLDSHKPESLQGAPRLQPFLTGPDYLRTMRMHLLQGRFLNAGDTVKTPCVAVIDRDFAAKFFPDGTAIGHTITAGFAAFGPCAIVGIVNHVKNRSLHDAGTGYSYQAYYALYQDPDQWVPVNYPDASMVVRTPLEAATIIPAIKTALSQLGDDQPIYNVQTMQQTISNSMSEQRFPMILLGAFAALALLLVSVGVYGIISYAVSERVQEIAIRMALGADKGKVVRRFVGQELKLVLGGMAVGAVLALLLSRTLSSFSRLLYGVSSADPLTFAVVSISLIALAALAAYIPARRAATVDPMVALRYE